MRINPLIFNKIIKPEKKLPSACGVRVLYLCNFLSLSIVPMLVIYNSTESNKIVHVFIDSQNNHEATVECARL